MSAITTRAVDLHLLTNCPIKCNDRYLNFINNCAKAGINYLQLRQKNWSFANLYSFGCELKTILATYSIPLIINDNLKLAVKLDAQGIHLGQSDNNPLLAREALGENKIIGLSIENLAELHYANKLKCINYVAASAVFPSISKANLKTLWGIDGLKQFCSLSKHPVVAIGGITHTNLNSIIQLPVHGIAIISAIHQALDPATYIQNLLIKLNNPSY